MAELETIPLNDAEAEEERRRRAAEALKAQPAAEPTTPSPVVAPVLRGHHTKGASDLELAESIDRSRPSYVGKSIEEPTAPDIGQPAAVNTGLQPVSASPLKPLSFAERQALPTISPGAPAGSAASYQSQLERLEDQKRNPFGSAENHPGKLGKLEHVLGKVGNIAGSIVAPSVMEIIPGTDLNRRMEERTLERNLAGAQEREERGKEAEARNTTENRRLDIEENKPAKEPTIDQRAIDAKVKEINPDTGKPYTDYEARIELANDIAAGKASAKPPGNPKTVVMLDKEGGKPYEYEYDAKGNYSGDQGYQHWKKIGPAKPDALSLGLIGSIAPLIDPASGQIVGTINSKTGDMKPLSPKQQETVSGTGGTTTGGARTATTRQNQFNTQYVKPSTDIEQNFRKFQTAYQDYLKDPKTGAASMVALAQHLGSTFGSIKGTTQGEHMISEHKNAIGLLDRIERAVDNAASGQQLSASQWKEFGELIAATRQIQWETTAREAIRRKQPVDFLPADVQIRLADSKGNARAVPGNRVQEYLDKGAKLAE